MVLLCPTHDTSVSWKYHFLKKRREYSTENSKYFHKMDSATEQNKKRSGPEGVRKIRKAKASGECQSKKDILMACD